MKPTRLYFARPVSLFCSLTLLFGDVLHDVAVVVFFNSPLLESRLPRMCIMSLLRQHSRHKLAELKPEHKKKMMTLLTPDSAKPKLDKFSTITAIVSFET